LDVERESYLFLRCESVFAGNVCVIAEPGCVYAISLRGQGSADFSSRCSEFPRNAKISRQSVMRLLVPFGIHAARQPHSYPSLPYNFYILAASNRSFLDDRKDVLI